MRPERPRCTQTVIIVGIAIVLVAACTGPQATPSPSPAPPPTSAPVPTATPTPAPPAEHRIGVRTANGEPEFYDRITSDKFVPRGGNLWRWYLWERPGDSPALIDTMFNTQIGQLESALAELPRMSADGYNVVRVWANACWGGAPGCMDRPGGGLDPAYLRNLAEFLRVAKDNGVYVMLTMDDVPEQGGYRMYWNRDCCNRFNGFNLDFMAPGGLEASRRYYTDMIKGLVDVGAPMDAIWAYELRNEGFFEAQLPPLSRASGEVTAANGNTYDLADPAQRRALMEESWVYWIGEMVTAIKDIDPTALVTMGFFVQNEPIDVHPGDPRLVYLDKVLNESALDFVDLHGYPGFDLNMAQHAQNFAIADGYSKKPLVLGEFGAHRQNFPDVEKAAAALQAWQVASCQFGFDGWLMWTWSGGDLQDEFWTALAGDGAIRRALSPTLHPDPCQPGSEAGDELNLALFKPVTASNQEGLLYQAANAVDLSMGSWWSANGGPPQWIEIDLQQPATIGAVRLYAGWVAPTGYQRHRVWVKGPGTSDAYELLHEFALEVAHDDVLEYILPQPMDGIRFVKVETLEADGWVIWHEIEVLRGE